MRISLTEWAAQEYSESVRPTLRTLKQWARNGQITDCVKQNGQWMPSCTSVYRDVSVSVPAGVSGRVADILRAA